MQVSKYVLLPTGLGLVSLPRGQHLAKQRWTRQEGVESTWNCNDGRTKPRAQKLWRKHFPLEYRSNFLENYIPDFFVQECVIKQERILVHTDPEEANSWRPC